MPQIKAGSTFFSLDTFKRSDILVFNRGKKHWKSLYHFDIFHGIFWISWSLKPNCPLKRRSVPPILCKPRWICAAQKHAQTPSWTLSHQTCLLRGDTWKKTCFQSAAALTRPASHEPRSLRRSLALLIPFQQQPDTVGSEVTQIWSAISDIWLVLIFITSSHSNSKFQTDTDDYFTD